MKKNLLFLLSLALILACTPRKNAYVNRKYQNFTTLYNVLFNGEEALSTELDKREKAYKENFNAPYIRLLTYEETGSSTEMEKPGLAEIEDGAPSNLLRNNMSFGVGATGISALKIAEIKAEKAIEKHATLFNGQEKNTGIFEAYLLLAKARLFQNQPLEALDALNTLQKVFKNDKRLPLAKIYAGYAYGKLKDFYRADETFRALKDQKLKKAQKKLASIFYSEILLNAQKKEEAVAELDLAYRLHKDKKMRSRIAFLRGQILAELGEKEKARASFMAAYKNARDFEFEVKSQIEIAKTFSAPEEYEKAKRHLEKISQRGTYASRKNELSYALGLLALQSGKKDEAMSFFKKSTQEKMSDPQIRGLAYYEIGKKHFEDSDYLSAGVYYDSAYAVMTFPPVKEKLKGLAENSKEVSKNYYLIQKNDSILALTKMSNDEKVAYFSLHIEQLKIKEAKDENSRKKKREETNSPFEDAGFSLLQNPENNSSLMDFSGSKSFYFANPSTISKGNSEFKKMWGNRSLIDNWRTSTKMNTLEDLKYKALGISAAPNPRRLEPNFYIEKIPTKPEEILSLKKARDTASLGLGRMYESYFSNTSLATKTLYDLVDASPEPEIELQALYQIFSMNYEKTPPSAERAKQMILEKHPYTSYAEFVKNPKKEQLTLADAEVEKTYVEAYALYTEEKFEASKKLTEEAILKYPKDLLLPKFFLLRAFNTGKTDGKEVMILQLEQLMLNYAKTTEGIKAKEMLKVLKSELKAVPSDGSAQPSKNNRPSAAATQNSLPTIQNRKEEKNN